MWTQISPPRWWVELSRPVIACNLQTMEHAFEAKCSRKYAASRRSRFMDSSTSNIDCTRLVTQSSKAHLYGTSSLLVPSVARTIRVPWLAAHHSRITLAARGCGPWVHQLTDHLLQTVNTLNPSQVAAWEQAVHAISTLKIQSSVLTQSCTEVRGRHPFSLYTLDLVFERKALTLGSFMFLQTFQHHHHWTTFRILHWTTFSQVLHPAAPPWPRHLSFAVPTHRWDSPRWRRPWSGRMRWCRQCRLHLLIKTTDLWPHRESSHNRRERCLVPPAKCPSTMFNASWFPRMPKVSASPGVLDMENLWKSERLSCQENAQLLWTYH